MAYSSDRIVNFLLSVGRLLKSPGQRRVHREVSKTLYEHYTELYGRPEMIVMIEVNDNTHTLEISTIWDILTP